VHPAQRKQVPLCLWPQRYVVAKLVAVPEVGPALDASGAPVALVVGHGEVSLLAPEEVVERVAALVVSRSEGWRAATLDAVFPLDSIGVLAVISEALAKIEVPLMVFSSHDTDHLLFPESHLGRALAVIHNIRLERLLGRDGQGKA
jgi:hypothetical protein